MTGDVASLAADMAPYLSAAVSSCGDEVLAPVRDDEATDTAVGLGRHLLVRVFGSLGEAEPLPGPLADLVERRAFSRKNCVGHLVLLMTDFAGPCGLQLTVRMA